MQSRTWCQARRSFDALGAIGTPGSPFCSPVWEHACKLFIPGYQGLPEKEQKEASLQLLQTGQACPPSELDQHDPTVLLVVETGFDGFQPIKRRAHSTLVGAFRCLNLAQWHVDKASAAVVNTLVDGPVEASALDSILNLHVEDLQLLMPPHAPEDGTTRAGA